MKKIITINSRSNMEKLAEFADGFIASNDAYATRLQQSFEVDELKNIIKEAHRLNKEVFISMNRMMHNSDMISFKSFVVEMEKENPTGYIVGDIGVVYLLKTLGIEEKAVYNPETLLANVFDFNFNATLGISGAFLAKEITFEDIITITNEKKLKAFMYVHGFLNMFYSKRQLISSYFENIRQENTYHDKKNLKIKEEKRPDLSYPILEDQGGTHVFRDKVFTSINQINDLKDHVDYAVFDFIFHDDTYAYDILSIYQQKLDGKDVDYRVLEEKYSELWDDGFFYKKTVYKPKKVTRWLNY